MRIMRVIVMFDLPTGTPDERRSQARFRKFLVEEGYTMEQFSIYSKIAMGRASADTARFKVRLNCPAFGSVEVLTLTEKQYAARDILVSDVRHSKEQLGTQLTLDL